MPIDPDFPKNHQTIGKHKHADGEHFHFVWGPGRADAETSTNTEVQEADKARGVMLHRPNLQHSTKLKCSQVSCFGIQDSKHVPIHRTPIVAPGPLFLDLV